MFQVLDLGFALKYFLERPRLLLFQFTDFLILQALITSSCVHLIDKLFQFGFFPLNEYVVSLEVLVLMLLQDTRQPLRHVFDLFGELVI